MSVTPLTSTGLALFKLERMVSRSTVFQSFTGVGSGNATGALEFIHIPRKAAKKNQKDKPFAVIAPPLANTVDPEFSAGGGANWFIYAGGVEFSLYRDVGQHPTEKDELYEFLNFAEGVLGDVLDLAAVDDHLAITAAPCVFGPAKSNPGKVAGDLAQRPFYKISYAVKWK